MALKWLKNKPKGKRGLSFGYPWEKGALQPEVLREELFLLGEEPLQTKVLAYWPDGSVKWTGHSGLVAETTQLLFQRKQRVQKKQAIAREAYNGIYFDNGTIKGFFPKHGEGKNVLDWVAVNGQKKLQDLHAILQYQNKKVQSKVTDLMLEENGSEKAVIKVSGVIEIDQEVVQEFILRFRIFREISKLEIIHTVIIIKPLAYEGMGIAFDYALTGENWNRQVKFIADAVYHEAAQLLLSRRHYQQNIPYQEQASGQLVSLTPADEQMLSHAVENAIWDNFRVNQINHRSFELEKQTEAGYCWLPIGDGAHYSGTFYAGGETGGVACSMEKFWEKAPSAIEVTGITQKETQITMWQWSPNTKPMDFQHYSKRDHMLSGYEGMEEIRSTAVGVANTTRCWLDLYEEAPSEEVLLGLAQENKEPAQIVSLPERYQETKVFGRISLPDESTKTKQLLEQQLAKMRQFYLAEVQQRSWYGYWNYGDVMHTYDQFRHQWRYDLGGYAWQNTELVPNMWLWLDFLRTGDPSVYYLAESMTRHTSEVDQYHSGEYKGLGSRHNVVHWGCQAKEVRISMAGLHRYYYYLTADERIGEIMEQVKDNETYAFHALPPMREFYERETKRIPIRIGPDWAALVSNWFTQWERTNDPVYLEKIRTGITCIKAIPQRLLSGPTVLFDPQDKTLSYMGTGNFGGYHMVISFGAPQVWLELAQVLEDPEWTEMLGEFGWFYSLSPERKAEESNGVLTEPHFAWPMFASTMMAFAGRVRNDQAISQRAWQLLLDNDKSGVPLPIEATIEAATTWKKIKEMPWVSTNVLSQWGLNTICCLALIGAELEEENEWKQQ